MIKILKVSAILFFTLFIMVGLCAGIEAKNSRERIKRIEKIIKNYQKAGLDLQDPDVYSLILKDVSKIAKLKPGGKLDNRSSQQIMEAVRKLVRKSFPAVASEILKEAEKEAAAKFKMVSILDKVKVWFNKGKTLYKAEGIFYGYGGNSIHVDHQIIAIYDLLPESRVKFDKVFCEKKRQEFIENRLQNYYFRKNDLTRETYKSYKENQVRKNEKMGYLFAWKRWHSPKEIVHVLVNSINKKKSDKNAGKRNQDVTEKPVKTDIALYNGKNQESSASISDKRSSLLPHERIRQEAREKLIRIRRTSTGVDADRGYKLACWGMSREDIKQLFPHNLTPGNGNMETIQYKDGPIEKISLHFYKGHFHKVSITFRVLSGNGVRELINQLYERYGETDEQLQEQETESENDENGSPNENKTGEEIEKETEPDIIPQVRNFTWSGKYTKAVTTIRLDNKREKFTDFVLVKRAVGLTEKIDAELKRKIVEKERKKREKYLKQLKKGIVF